jgi:pimeloyl-ACP methyl ester carboxylesterase
VILVHGNRSYKEAHRYQGEHLASFGFRVYLPQLPTTDVWATNGIMLKTFTEWVVRRLSDKNSPKPILVGHSFGGSAVTMAAYLGTAVSGLILLDPAIFNDSVADLLGDTNCPAILLGADPKVFRSKQRSLFKKKFAGPFVELSVKGATHNDAQFPTMFSLSNFGLDPEVELKRQKLFTYLMTASAFSLSMDPNDQNSKGKRDDRLTLIRTLAKSLKKDGYISEFYQRPPI